MKHLIRRRTKAICMAAFMADGWTLVDNLKKTIVGWKDGWTN